MNPGQISNAVLIAKLFNTFTDDEIAVFKQSIDGLPPEGFTGQLARFAKTQAELKLVTSLFSKLGAIPVLAAA